MNESENALPPLNEEFWEHANHAGFKVVISVAGGYLNMMNALGEIYDSIKTDKKDEALYLTTGLAAVLFADKFGKSKEVLEEMTVHIAKGDMDNELRKLLNEAGK